MFQTRAQRYIRQTIHFNEEFMKCFKITALVLAAALASIAVGVQVLALFCLYVVAFRGETICPFYPEIDTRFAPGFSKAGFEKIECGMPGNKVVDLIGPPLWIQEFWNKLLFPPPGNLPNPGTEPASLMSSALAGRFFTAEPPGKP